MTDDVVAKAQALVDALDACMKRIQDGEVCLATGGFRTATPQPYDGPTFGDELTALREALAKRAGSPPAAREDHLCGLKGFGYSLGDVCPACETERAARGEDR